MLSLIEYIIQRPDPPTPPSEPFSYLSISLFSIWTKAIFWQELFHFQERLKQRLMCEIYTLYNLSFQMQTFRYLDLGKTYDQQI